MNPKRLKEGEVIISTVPGQLLRIPLSELRENTERRPAASEDVLNSELVIDVAKETYGSFVVFGGEVPDNSFRVAVGSRDDVIRCFEVTREKPDCG